MIDLYAYVRTHDSGVSRNHAPHFANGLMSLANCKAAMRQHIGRHAKVGSWLVGLTSPSFKGEAQRYVSYIARVDGIIDRVEYWEKFSHQMSGGRWDNYYEPVSKPDGRRVNKTAPHFYQHKQKHHNLSHGDFGRDMQSHYVLLSHTWRDYGATSKQPVPWGWLVDALNRKPVGHLRFPLAAPINLNTLEINLCL